MYHNALIFELSEFSETSAQNKQIADFFLLCNARAFTRRDGHSGTRWINVDNTSHIIQIYTVFKCIGMEIDF